MNIHLLNLHFVFHLWASRTELYTEDCPPICQNKLCDGKILQNWNLIVKYVHSCLVGVFQNTLKTQPLSLASSSNLGLEQNFDLLCTLECIDGSGGGAGAILPWKTKVIWVGVLEELGREHTCLTHACWGDLEGMIWNYTEDCLLGSRVIPGACRNTCLLCLDVLTVVHDLFWEHQLLQSVMCFCILYNHSKKEWNT